MTEQTERRLLPGVSVLTTTYNRADVLGRAIESVLAQDTPDWELMIVDNGSTDGTQELLGTYQDERIKTIRIDPNRGCTGGRNVCLDNISREWFTFLDSDDQLVPHALSTLLAVPGVVDRGVDAVECNCIDSRTGAFAGQGLDHDQWLDQRTFMSLRGEYWGITKTSVLNGRRFNEKIQMESILWYQLEESVKRYYIHQGLKIYMTEGGDRLSVRQPYDASFYSEYVALLDEERAYLEMQAKWAPDRYSSLLFHAFQVFLVSGDLSRARSAYRELRRRGLAKDRIKARIGLTFGLAALDTLSRARQALQRWLPGGHQERN
jgi:glycosyltransferase involved in cell wall biosynthesis